MKYNFDEIIDRRNTNALNTDGFRGYIFHAGPEKVFPFKDEEFTRSVRFKLKGIAPGEYILKMSLISGTPRGRTVYFDTIVDVSRFIITDDPAVNDGFIWSERLWGNFRMLPLELEG